MTDFLVRCFVKEYENTDNADVRTSYGILSSMVGICCNVLLFAAKLLIGVGMHSLAIMADAFNNLSDAASSVISFVGVKMANKPADKEHPFGHGRIEYIAALIVSFLVIEVGFTFLKSSLEKIRNPEEITFQMVPFLILVLSVGVKLWMALFNRKLGNRIQSKVMLATSADSMGDVITTSATIASTLICHFLSVNIDAIAGLVVAVLVMWSGISIAKDTLEPLIGQGADPDLYARIMKEVASYEACLFAVFRNRSLTHLFIFILCIQIKNKHALRIQIIVDEREDFPQIVFLQNIVDGIADAHNRLHGSVELKFPHILKQI